MQKTMNIPKYKLHYFDVRSRGEVIRMIFAEKGIPFEDIRISFEDWPKIKPTTPKGKLPYLECGSDVMCESLAIARYLAREFGLYGNNNRAMAKVDEIIDIVTDVMNPFYAAVTTPDEEKKKTMLKDVHEKNYPYLMDQMEKILAASKTGFLVGPSVTIADFSLYNVLNNVINIPSLWEKRPKCKEHFNRIANLPRIKAWIRDHPRSDL